MGFMADLAAKRSVVAADPGPSAAELVPLRSDEWTDARAHGLTKWICQAHPPRVPAMSTDKNQPPSGAGLSFTRAAASHPRRRLSAVQHRRDGPAPRGDRNAAARGRTRSPGVLRRQPLRLGGAMADRLAGDGRGGRRVHAGRAGRAVRAARQSRAAGAAARRPCRSRLGRRLVDRRQRSRSWSAGRHGPAVSA